MLNSMFKYVALGFIIFCTTSIFSMDKSNDNEQHPAQTNVRSTEDAETAKKRNYLKKMHARSNLFRNTSRKKVLESLKTTDNKTNEKNK